MSVLQLSKSSFVCDKKKNRAHVLDVEIYESNKEHVLEQWKLIRNILRNYIMKARVELEIYK